MPFVTALVPKVDVKRGKVLLDPAGRAVRRAAGGAGVRLDVVTIFGEYLQPLQLSLIGKAQAQGLLDVRVHDLREHTHDRHRTVDDTPYGGGAGLLMKPEPWGEALDAVLADPPPGADERGPVLRGPLPGGGGRSPSAPRVELAGEPWLVFACGRYEGIDARVVEHYCHPRSGCARCQPGRLRPQRGRGRRAGHHRGRRAAAAGGRSATPPA